MSGVPTWIRGTKYTLAIIYGPNAHAEPRDFKYCGKCIDKIEDCVRGGTCGRCKNCGGLDYVICKICNVQVCKYCACTMCRTAPCCCHEQCSSRALHSGLVRQNAIILSDADNEEDNLADAVGRMDLSSGDETEHVDGYDSY